MRDSFHFLRAILRDRRSVGAIAPSGRLLASIMVQSLGPVPPASIIVELGPGTGVFTKLLARRHPQAQIVAIEIDSQLAANLRRICPSVHVVEGCATAIRTHLANLGMDSSRVAGIVSGLPLLALPGNLPSRILEEIALALPEGRPFVQFTYSRLAWKRFAPQHLHFRRSQLVVHNFPPATVLTFTKNTHAVGHIASKHRRPRLLTALSFGRRKKRQPS